MGFNFNYSILNDFCKVTFKSVCKNFIQPQLNPVFKPKFVFSFADGSTHPPFTEHFINLCC